MAKFRKEAGTVTIAAAEDIKAGDLVSKGEGFVMASHDIAAGANGVAIDRGVIEVDCITTGSWDTMDKVYFDSTAGTAQTTEIAGAGLGLLAEPKTEGDSTCLVSLERI